MFERFGRSAREAVAGAQEIAVRTGSSRVDTRHLLLALLGSSAEVADAVRAAAGDPGALDRALRESVEGSVLDRHALASLGIDLDAVNEQADRVFGPDSLRRAARKKGHIAFGRDAKKALELALRETIRLRDRPIAPRHLLLGVLRADCPGREALLEQEIDPASLRTALEEPSRRSA